MTANADWPPLPATTDPLHREVVTKTLVVRSSDAVVSDSHEVVENGQKILSVVKPSKAPIELGAAKRRIILSDASVVMLMWAFCVAATPTIVIVKSLKFMFESCNNECDMAR